MAALIIALLEHPEQHAQVTSCIKRSGHETIVVDSFARAKEILQVRAFDLIVSDVHLENGGSVFDFLKWVKSCPTLHQISFVLFSLQPTELAKYLAEGVQTAARILGAAKYISMDKFDCAVFTREIAELLPPAETEAPINFTEPGE